MLFQPEQAKQIDGGEGQKMSMTSPINLAATSGNGNKEFYRETKGSNWKYPSVATLSDWSLIAVSLPTHLIFRHYPPLQCNLNKISNFLHAARYLNCTVRDWDSKYGTETSSLVRYGTYKIIWEEMESKPVGRTTTRTKHFLRDSIWIIGVQNTGTV